MYLDLNVHGILPNYNNSNHAHCVFKRISIVMLFWYPWSPHYLCSSELISNSQKNPVFINWSGLAWLQLNIQNLACWCFQSLGFGRLLECFRLLGTFSNHSFDIIRLRSKFQISSRNCLLLKPLCKHVMKYQVGVGILPNHYYHYPGVISGTRKWTGGNK